MKPPKDLDKFTDKIFNTLNDCCLTLGRTIQDVAIEHVAKVSYEKNDINRNFITTLYNPIIVSLCTYEEGEGWAQKVLKEYYVTVDEDGANIYEAVYLPKTNTGYYIFVYDCYYEDYKTETSFITSIAVKLLNLFYNI